MTTLQSVSAKELKIKTWCPSEKDVERFTRGDCHIFARAINLRTNWPIRIFKEPAPEGNHAWVLTPEGLALDINGLQFVEDLLDEWKVVKHSFTTWETLRLAWDGAQYGAYSFKRAGILADKLLTHYYHD